MTQNINNSKEYITGIKDLIWPIFENKKIALVLAIKAIIFTIISYASIEVIRQAVVRIESGNQTELLLYIYWGFALVFVHIIVTLFTVKISRTARYYFNNSIYTRLYTKVFSLDHQFLDSRGIGKTTYIINDGASSRGNLLDRIADDLVKLIVSFVFALYYVQVFYGRRGVLLSIGVVLSTSWLVVQIDHRISTIRKQRNNIFQESSKQRHKIISNRFEILQQSQEKHESDAVIDLHNKAKKKTEEFAYYTVAYNSTYFFTRMVEVGLYGLIGVQIILGNQDFATLTLMTVIASRLFGQVGTITEEYQMFKDSKEKIDDLFSLLYGPKILGYKDGDTFVSHGGSFAIIDMNYGYNEDQLIFNQFNLTIAGGSRVALVGPSGGGKSTLIKLIAGYLHPLSGEILVDGQALPTPQNCHSESSETKGRIHMDPSLHSGGQNINHISLQSYYPHIGYLTQEPSVFDGTIRENLTYGLKGKEEGQEGQNKVVIAPRNETQGNDVANQGVEDRKDVVDGFVPRNEEKEGNELSKYSGVNNDEELINKINHIITLARCEFIHEFKDGLMTEIGEKGVRLSGGQRQRLAIAKIMLKDPAIILLDEPTSALDSENEELVTQALNELFKGKTVIVIAHRLQTVKHADQILYIDGGQIIESGTHTELIAMKGKYHRMVELQSGF